MYIVSNDPSTVSSDLQFLKRPVLSVVIADGTEIFLSDVHLLKQYEPSEVIDGGSFTSFKFLHPSKHLSSIIVTLDGSSTRINELHLLKANFPIFVTDGGIVMRSNEEQSSNALSHIS